jgi:integrase
VANRAEPFKRATDPNAVPSPPYLQARGVGTKGKPLPYIYRRPVPKDIAPLINIKVWWQRLGFDYTDAARQAADLDRLHSGLIARLRSKPVQTQLASLLDNTLSGVMASGGGAPIGAGETRNLPLSALVSHNLANIDTFRSFRDKLLETGPDWRSVVMPVNIATASREELQEAIARLQHADKILTQTEAMETILAVRYTAPTDTIGSLPLMSECIDAWLDAPSPKTSQGLKPVTKARYRATIRRFQDYAKNPALDQLKRDHGAKWLDSLHSTGQTHENIRIQRDVIQSFGTWMRDKYLDRIPVNPFDGLKVPVADIREEDERHQAAMSYGDVPTFVRSLIETSSTPARALLLTILTGARIGMALKAEWSQFDLSAKVWKVPAGHMKARKVHTLPLSSQAVALVMEEQAKGRTTTLVFPSPVKGKLMSRTTVALLMEKTQASDEHGKPVEGVRATIHGFRSSLTKWADDAGYDPDTVEHILAHTVGNKVSRAYRRGLPIDRMRELLNAWANYVSSPA